jgi:hypothetical protein
MHRNAKFLEKQERTSKDRINVNLGGLLDRLEIRGRGEVIKIETLVA